MEDLCFSVSLPEKQIHIKTVSLANSLFIWIGEGDLRFDNFNIASATKFSSTPSTVVLLGENSGTISHKLTKRLGKQVLLSYNVQSDPLNQSMNDDIIMKEIIAKLVK